MAFSQWHNKQIKEVVLPHVPVSVNPDHLINVTADGRLLLLTEIEIKQIKTTLAPFADGKYAKKTLSQFHIHIPFSVIKQQDTYYAVYYGCKQRLECGSGYYGVVKYIQQIESGEWALAKIQSVNNPFSTLKNNEGEIRLRGEKESASLKEMGLLLGSFQRYSKQKRYQHVMLMKLIRGITIDKLSTRLALRQSPLPMIFWLTLIETLCKALRSLHETHHIIHYDIYDKNIIYDLDTGQVSFIDFGLSEIFTQKEMLTHQDKPFDVFRLAEVIAELLSLINSYSVFYSKTSNAYLYNAKLTKASTRLAIRDYLKDEMMSDNATRASANDALGFFSQLKTQLPAYVKSTSFCDVQAYVQASDDEKSDIIRHLQQFDRVILVDSSDGLSLKQTIFIKQELESNLIFVANKMLTVSNKLKTMHHSALFFKAAKKVDAIDHAASTDFKNAYKI